MGKLRHQLETYGPFAISLVLLLIMASYIPWGSVFQKLSHISLWSIIIMTLATVIYYAAKALRYWYMLKVIGVRQPLGIVALAYLGAQPVSLLPAGELYRCKMIQRYTGAPMAECVPTFVAQGLYEGVVLGLFSVLGVLTLGRKVWPVLVVVTITLGALAILKSGVLAKYSDTTSKALNRLPFVAVSRQRLRHFSHQNQALLEFKTFGGLIALSLVAELGGAAVIYAAVSGLDSHLRLSQVLVAYALPIISSFVTLLPGGIGAHEQISIGLLLLFGLPLAIAAAVTLLVRVWLLIGGQLIGLVSFLILTLSQRPTKSS